MRSIFVLLILVMIGLNGKGQSVTALPDSVLSQCCLEVTLLNGNVTTVDWVFVQYITRDGTGTKLFVEYAPNFGGIQWETQIRIQDDFDEVLERSKFIMLPFTVGSTDYAINRNWIANIEENTTTGGTWVYGRFGTPTKRKFSAVEDYETLKNLLLACRPRAIVVAENGLYTEGDTVRMGGFLIEPTTIKLNGFNYNMIDTITGLEFAMEYYLSDTIMRMSRPFNEGNLSRIIGRGYERVDIYGLAGSVASVVMVNTGGVPTYNMRLEDSVYQSLWTSNSGAIGGQGYDKVNEKYGKFGVSYYNADLRVGDNLTGKEVGVGAFWYAGYGSMHPYIRTQSVADSTATNGQFLQLIDELTGAANWVDLDLSSYLEIGDTAAMLANYVTFGNLSGYPTGTGITDRSARWSGTNTLAAGNITDNSTKLEALKPFQFNSSSLAGLPTGVSRYIMDISDYDWFARYSSTAGAWIPPVQASPTGLPGGKGMAGSVLFLDANGRATQDNSNLFWNNTYKRLGVGITNPQNPLDVLGNISTNGGSVTATGSSSRFGNFQILTSGNAGTTGVGVTVTAVDAIADFQWGANGMRFRNYAGVSTGLSIQNTYRYNYIWKGGVFNNPAVGSTGFVFLGMEPIINSSAKGNMSSTRSNVVAHGLRYRPTVTKNENILHSALSIYQGNSLLGLLNGSTSIGIDSIPNPSAILHINPSGNQGVLLPHMTSSERSLIYRGIQSVTVTTGGSGYLSTDTLKFSTGSEIEKAYAFANISGGGVSTVGITTQGKYTSTPTVVTTGSGTGATFTVNMTNPEGVMWYNSTLKKPEWRNNLTNMTTYNYDVAQDTGYLGGKIKIKNTSGDSIVTNATSENLLDIFGNYDSDSAWKSKFSFYDYGYLYNRVVDDSDDGNARFGIERARGTITSPTTVLQNDRIGELMFRAHGSSSYRNAAEIFADVDSVSGNSVQGVLKFGVAKDGEPYLTANRVMWMERLRARVFQAFQIERTGVSFSVNPYVDTLYFRGTTRFSTYGQGNKEAADLSKTQSNYIAGFATDGTVLDLNIGSGLAISGGSLTATASAPTQILAEEYNTITSTSSPQTLSSTKVDNLINQGGTQASFTFYFPASPVDGQRLTITYNNAISALTLNGNGNTIVGTAVTTATAGSQRVFKFYTGIGWIRQN